MTKVVIDVAGHSVTVECDEDLDTAAAKVLDLWRSTSDPQMTRGYTAAGFTTERSGAQGDYTSGYESQ